MNQNNIQANKTLLLYILISIPLALFLNLNSYQLIFEEPRRALVAMEMLINENSIVPSTNGILYYNKPPLYNWILIALFKLFGTEEWVVRVPTVLSLVTTALVHYFLSKKYIGKNAALLSALFYITSADILFFFSYLGEIDLFYALLVYLQAASIFYFYDKRQWALLFLTSYLLAAAGVLTKGIPSIVFQGISILMIFILNKDYKRLFSIWHFVGIGVFLVLCGAYFFAYAQHYPVEPYLARLFTQTFSRSAMENSAGSNLLHLLKFPFMLIKISTPWCLLFLLPVPYKKLIRENRFLKYCFWFVLTNILIYWLSPGSRERYLYMFFPFIFSCLAYGILSTNFRYRDVWIKRFHLYISILLIIGLPAISYLAFKEGMVLAGITGVLLAIFPALFIRKQQNSFNLLLTVVFLILIGRIGYDLSVLPNRKKNDRYKEDARIMAPIIKDQPVYLVGPPEKTEDIVKFAGVEFATFHRYEPTYLAFQSSFYLSKFSGKIVQYTSDMSKKGFYIVSENAVDRRKEKVYYRFRNRADIWFLLIKKD